MNLLLVYVQDKEWTLFQNGLGSPLCIASHKDGLLGDIVAPRQGQNLGGEEIFFLLSGDAIARSCIGLQQRRYLETLVSASTAREVGLFPALSWLI